MIGFNGMRELVNDDILDTRNRRSDKIEIENQVSLWCVATPAFAHRSDDQPWDLDAFACERWRHFSQPVGKPLVCLKSVEMIQKSRLMNAAFRMRRFKDNPIIFQIHARCGSRHDAKAVLNSSKQMCFTADKLPWRRSRSVLLEVFDLGDNPVTSSPDPFVNLCRIGMSRCRNVHFA